MKNGTMTVEYLEQEKVEVWQWLEVGNAILTISKTKLDRL
jgi:hypothetical protein